MISGGADASALFFFHPSIFLLTVNKNSIYPGRHWLLCALNAAAAASIRWCFAHTELIIFINIKKLGLPTNKRL